MSVTEMLPDRASTGIAGLDDILNGGLTPHRMYLVEGTPGTGKTTLGLGFLLAGAAIGESGPVYHAGRNRGGASRRRGDAWLVARRAEPVRDGARPTASARIRNRRCCTRARSNSARRSATSWRRSTSCARRASCSTACPNCACSRRARSATGARSWRSSTSSRPAHCTVLFLDDKSGAGSDLQLHSIAHGVVSLEQTLSGFGAQRRRLHVVKMRGVRYRGGYHDFEIERGGLCVYPRLVASDHETTDAGAVGLDRDRANSTRCSAAGWSRAPRRC